MIDIDDVSDIEVLSIGAERLLRETERHSDELPISQEDQESNRHLQRQNIPKPWYVHSITINKDYIRDDYSNDNFDDDTDDDNDDSDFEYNDDDDIVVLTATKDFSMVSFFSKGTATDAVSPPASYPEKICPICMENIFENEPSSTNCGHLFCFECIQKAIRNSRKCPMCAKRLKNIHRIYV